MQPIDTREAAVSRWNAVWARIVELGAVAGSYDPSSEPLERLRTRMEDLEAIRTAFEDLAPKLHSTAEVRDALRAAISEIAAGLDVLHGESFNAPALLSALFEVSELAEPSAVDGADGLVRQIRTLLTETTSLVARIAEIEAKLPKMKAKAETDPLIHRYDKLLRDALGLAESAVELLPGHRNVTPAPRPPSDTGPGTGAVEQEGAPTVDPVQAANAVDDDLVDMPVGDVAEPYDPNETFAAPEVLSEPPPAAEIPAPDPLRDEVVARLDRLFALGEYGLAYHLREAASQIMSDADLPYTPAELRLASAAGRTIALTGQDHFSLAEQRGEALSTAQALSDAEDDRSLARRNLLLAGAVPAAIFRADDVAAVSLVESIGGKGPFANYFKLVQVVDENRKRGFLLTPANVLAIEAHSRDDTYVADSVAGIKETIDGFRQSRFRFVLGEKVKHALT
ncbi:MAG: hypothetical protein Q8S13_09035, partial [Dehalococcoidia bacterium]|nr:hypothetical protein [Dehalococcoidia bacterium]